MAKPPDTPTDAVQAALDRGDPIAALCAAVEEAGLTMTLYGQPVGEKGLRAAATAGGLARLTGEPLTPDETKAIASSADEEAL